MMMVKISSILPKLKANSLTYYNLDKKSVSDFKKSYSYLKKNKDKEVLVLWAKDVIKILEDKTCSDYVRKFKAINIISTSIKLKK